ncbi:MAG: MFS transporter [Dehalococcoidales bacterium]|nr:MFS transporter [Dehalococcoidales bacterium]
MRWVRAIASSRLGVRLALMNFFLNVAVEASNVFMPLYAKDLGASNLQVGFTAAAFGLSFFVSSIVSGRQSDIHGRLIFVRAGLLLSVIAYLAQIFTPSPPLLMVVRGLVGFGFGLISAAVMAFTYENQTQIGRFASYGAAGWLLGALLAAIFKNYYALFVASSASSGLALLVSLTFREGERVRV